MSTKLLVIEAKRMQRLQDKRRKLRRELRTVEDEMKLCRQQLRAMTIAVGKPWGDEEQLSPRLKGRGK